MFTSVCHKFSVQMDAYLERQNVLKTPHTKLSYIQYNSVRDINVPPRVIFTTHEQN